MVVTYNFPIHDPGKIDIHDRENILKKSLDRVTHETSLPERNKRLILDFIRDCLLGKNYDRTNLKSGKITGGRSHLSLTSDGKHGKKVVYKLQLRRE